MPAYDDIASQFNSLHTVIKVDGFDSIHNPSAIVNGVVPMSEIKSTLDLIMERTRDMKMTAEERQENTANEFRGRIAGLVQKYQDELIGIQEFRRGLEELESEMGFSDKAVVAIEISSRVEFGEDNERVLELLRETCGIDTEKVSDLFQSYWEKLLKAGEERKNNALKELSEKRGISGSALSANIEHDQEWENIWQEERYSFLTFLEREIRSQM